MKDLILKMLSNSDDVSHKRFISLASFVVFIGLVVASCCKVSVDYTLAGMLLALILGQSAYTLVGKKDTPQQ